MRKKQKIAAVIALIVLMIAGVMLFYLMSYAKPMPEALAAMKSDETVAVADGKIIVFQPLQTNIKKALIIYPGGKVDPRAYAPIARSMAEAGIKTMIVRMPFNLAVFGSNKADDVINDENIKEWYISGHSLGGVMAARYTKQHQDVIDGLILWGAYPEEASDLSKTKLSVLSIYGTNDGLTMPGDITNTMHLLPDTVQWVSINGGNHSQFGWYGFQKGDNQAEISREEQQQEVTEATIEFIKAGNE